MTFLEKPIWRMTVLIAALAPFFSSALGDGPTAVGQVFAVLVAAQNKIEEDLKHERFTAESTQSSIQSALPSAFVYVSSTGIVFLSLENEITVVLEPKMIKNKAVAWNCAARFTGDRNRERAQRLRCIKLVAIDSRASK